ncbi:ATP-binding protein [Streptomyces sp. NPDC021019]|uniref:ATP-binding protein n=1 Tax=Streptomyces sp. NPDC021019 TaxID=3365108 RepID=UPI0037B89050
MLETLSRVAVPGASAPAVRRRSSRRIGALIVIETGAGPMPAYTETLPRVAASAQCARRMVRLALDVWGLPGVQDAAELVVSELLTNSVLHARRDSVRVTVTRLGQGRVRVAVVDLSRDRPAVRAADDDAESGRGLDIVETLSCGRWGVDPLPWGKRVWADLGQEVKPDE